MRSDRRAAVIRLHAGMFLVACGQALLSAGRTEGEESWGFADVTQEAGLQAHHAYRDPFAGTAVRMVAGGVAVGDYDLDGWVDLYIECGDAGSNALYRNRGDGSFEDVTQEAGVALDAFLGSGPLFFDFDNDGWPDLFVGGIDGDPPVLFHNRGDGTFENVSLESGIVASGNTVSATAADVDEDGWLDLFLSHWGSTVGDCHLWHNQRDGTFRCFDAPAGLSPISTSPDFTFTANFADLNDDRHLDLLLTADFGHSTVWLNDGNGHFEPDPSTELSDENGMGGAVGDYDNDGDLDWFVSSIWDGDGVTEGNWGSSGNRLYRNRGDGSFEDATDEAGVRQGDWGWGSSFADLDNDGHLDLVHVNGWPRGSSQFHEDPSRIFLADGQGGFQESAADLQFVDTDQGRGVVCFDYDRDGDIDILVANNTGPVRLWRNLQNRTRSFLTVRLTDTAHKGNVVGSRVQIQDTQGWQLREMRCGSNYVSQNPLEAHFGLGAANLVDVVDVTWPDGSHSTLFDISVNQVLEVDRSTAVLPNDGRSSPTAIPNPFHRNTTITLGPSRSSRTGIQIFDVRGHLVRTLRASLEQAETDRLVWDGRDQAGRAVSSGIYYMRVVGSEAGHTARVARVR